MQPALIEAIAIFLAAFGGTQLLRRVLIKRRILDVPNARSSHSRPVPRGGGLSIVVTFLPAVILLTVRGVLAANVTAAIVGGGLLIAGVGLIDDLYSLPAWLRAAVHFVAASWAVLCIGGPTRMDFGWLTLEWAWVGRIAAVIGLVWMTNLYNFMDGIDALGGLEAVTAGALGSFLLIMQGRSDLAELAMLLACACGGFLVWNWPPARIFLGDAGSGFLGFVLGVLVIACAKDRPGLVWTWLILLGVFIVDATVTLIRRLIRGDRWYKAHRTHAYQRASRLWQSHAKVTLGVGAVNLIWLFPMAWWATVAPSLALFLTSAALLPLVWIAVYLRAGEPETISERDRREASPLAPPA
jgi:Fuc2NAc and GlcNAc transferase